MFGQIPDFNDGFEFLRKMWGNAAGMPTGLMPGLQAMTPPMDLEEVDKRIHDLKAVESWLQLNANLLRTTIHGLEVQRATLVALKTVGEALSPDALQSAMENVARAANAPSATSPRGAPAPQPAPGAEGIDPSDLADMAEMEGAPDADHGQGASDDPARAGRPSPDPAQAQGQRAGQPDAGDTSPPPHAGLWWDMLQRQFNQIASSAAAASLASLNNLGAFGAGQPAGDAARHGEAGAQSAQPAGSPGTAGKPATKGRAKTAAKSSAKAAAKTAGTPDAGATAAPGQQPAGKRAGPARRGKPGTAQ